MSLCSQNGWRVLDREDLTWFTAAGQRFAAANADVATIFAHVINRFHAEVEHIKGPVLDDWSFAVRNVRGSSTQISNHSSATAIDLDALKHPRGVRGTFSAEQARRWRAIAYSVTDQSGDRVLRLGMDYTVVPDDMHVEIAAGARSVHQAAEKIRAARRAQEDDVNETDIKAIAKEVVKLLSSTANIPNQALHDGEPPAAPWTLPGAVSNIEKNQDQENERTAADRKADAVARRQVAEIHAAVVKPAKQSG